MTRFDNLDELGSTAPVALITGAARGQGRAHAVKLAHDGYDIIALDLCADIETVPYPLAGPADLAETADLVRATGQRVVTVNADVRDVDLVATAADAAVAELGGRLDVVVVNAGVISIGRSWELTKEQWSDVVDTNLTGAWGTVRAATPHLIATGGGSIVLIGSLAGMQGQRNAIHYTASKHALIGMTMTYANELAEYSIRVNCVCPTNVATPMLLNDHMFRLFRPDLEEPTEQDATEHFHRLNLQPVPYVMPEDVSEAVSWIISDKARHLTGVTLPVDAGGAVKS